MIRVCPNCGQKNRIPNSRLTLHGKCGKCKHELPPVAEPINVDTQAFDEIISHATKPVLVDFWAEWCAPCRQAAPQVARAAKELAGEALVLKVDTQASPDLAARYNVRGIPNFALFRSGRLVMQRAGLVPYQQLVQWARQA